MGVGTMVVAAGSALLVPFAQTNATATTYPTVLRTLGVLIGVGALASALVLRPPSDAGDDADRSPPSATSD